MKNSQFLAIFSLISSAMACGTNSMPGTSIQKEAINSYNQPERFNVPMTWSYDPDEFPEAGQSRKQVWTGSWWPMAQGGTRAALKKYDQAEGTAGAAEADEQAAIESGHGVSWAGHCNGLAAAGIHEIRPQRAVKYKGVTFTPTDIEALLVEKWQGTEGISLVGQRCQKTPTFDAHGRVIEGSCRDFNPGAFHIILGNSLGMEQEPFILDIEPGEAVWNYPVVAYQTETSVIDRAEAISLTLAGTQYSFNPEAEQFMRVKARITLATGKSKSYEYVLEGRNDRIIGGEWIGSSLQDHPDFAWMSVKPARGHTKLDFAVIDAIAVQSH